jgi:hypothetical protein
MAFRDSSPSTSRRGRSAIARTSTLALSVVAGSLALWAAPAGAATAIPDDDECVVVGSIGVRLLNFKSLITSASYDVTEGVLTIDVAGPANPFFLFDYQPALEFWSNTDCTGTNSLPSADYEFCATATSEDGTVGTYNLAEEFVTYFGTTRDLLLGVAYMLPRTGIDGSLLENIRPVFDTWDFEYDGNGDAIGDLSATFTFGVGACGGGDSGGGSGGRGPSIDLDYYIERAAAETSSLPDTL